MLVVIKPASTEPKANISTHIAIQIIRDGRKNIDVCDSMHAPTKLWTVENMETS